MKVHECQWCRINNGQTEQSKQNTIIKKRPSAQSLQAITYYEYVVLGIAVLLLQ